MTIGKVGVSNSLLATAPRVEAAQWGRGSRESWPVVLVVAGQPCRPSGGGAEQGIFSSGLENSRTAELGLP